VQAPAERGPTLKAPAWSRWAIEPPPAPIVCTSIIGTITGKPAIQVSRAVASPKPPSVTMPISAEVPPTSKVMSCLRPDSPAVHAPPRWRSPVGDGAKRVRTPPAACALETSEDIFSPPERTT